MAKLLLFLCAIQLCALVIGSQAPPTKLKDKLIGKSPPSLALAKKSIQIAKHAASLRKITKVLNEHVKIAPLKKGLALDKLAQKVKRIADAKERVAATIVKKTLPESMHGLRIIKHNARPSLKGIVNRLINKALHIIRHATDKLLHKEAKVNHKRAVKLAKQVTKTLKSMKNKGVAIPTKRAAHMVKQTLSPVKGQTAKSPRKLCGKPTNRQFNRIVARVLVQVKKYINRLMKGQKPLKNRTKELAIVKKPMHG